jgi:hypothetical protein
MISSHFDIKEFLEHANNLDDLGLIYLADQEATEAERLFYRNKGKKGGVDQEKLIIYVQTLKDLICFIRYGIKYPTVDGVTGQIFDETCRGLAENCRSQPRCLSEIFRAATTNKKSPGSIINRFRGHKK